MLTTKTRFEAGFPQILAALLLVVACTSTAPEPAKEVPQATPAQTATAESDRTLPATSQPVPPAQSQTSQSPASESQQAPVAAKGPVQTKTGSKKKSGQEVVTKSPERAKPAATGPKPPQPASPPPVSTKTACGADLPPRDFGRQDVYKNRPFQPGESAVYEVSYMGMHAGYGNIDVEAPIKHEGVWHQVFSGNASTGDWYEKIFIVKDKIRAISRPWDFGAAQFYIEQDEGTFFGRRFTQKKWINFDHDTCKVYEKTENRKKEIKNDEYQLGPGADDAMSAFFELRTYKFTPGKTERILVYTSEKNWFLDAEAIAEETVQVPAGSFKTIKLKLTTYLGKDLQQKGDVYIWIATEHPNRPMVRVEAEVKVGKIQITLKKFVAGRS